MAFFEVFIAVVSTAALVLSAVVLKENKKIKKELKKELERHERTRIDRECIKDADKHQEQ